MYNINSSWPIVWLYAQLILSNLYVPFKFLKYVCKYILAAAMYSIIWFMQKHLWCKKLWPSKVASYLEVNV